MKVPQATQESMQKVADDPDAGRKTDPWPAGTYLAELVEEKELEPKKDKEYGQLQTKWKFLAEGDTPRNMVGKHVVLWFSMSPAAAFKIGWLFDAMDMTFDTDTAEMVGEEAVLHLAVNEIEYGKNKGGYSNDLDNNQGGMANAETYEGEFGPSEAQDD